MSKKYKYPLPEYKNRNLISCNEDEIRIILRGADAIIAQGGRNLLSLILKGSNSQDILKYNLEKCPSYGAFRHLRLEEVLGRIDWGIRNDYLMLDIRGRLPVLIFAPRGWEIYKRIYAQELLSLLHAEVSVEIIVERLLNTHREIEFLLISMIKECFDTQWLPVLRKWQMAEVRTIKEAIEEIFEL